MSQSSFVSQSSLRHLLFTRPRITLALGVLVAAFGLAGLGNDAGGQPPAEQDVKMLRHVVLFQFKESSSEADVERVVEAFRKLPSKIPAIADFEHGVNNSPEGLSDGLTHCFLVTFTSEADRDAYLPHPAHKAFVELLKPHLQKATVVDYWAKQ